MRWEDGKCCKTQDVMHLGSPGFARARGQGNDTEAVKLVPSFGGVATRRRT